MSQRTEKLFAKRTKDTLLVAIGTLSLAFGTAIFIVPFDIIAGGISGIAIIIGNFVPDEIIGIDGIIAALTWGLFLIGVILLGRAFAIKTFISTVLYPPLFSLFYTLVSPDILGGYFYLRGAEYRDLSFLLAGIGGGALVGIGCALSFRGGGSTGGADILALIICKRSRFRAELVMLVIDAVIVILGVFTVRDMTHSVMGILCALTSSLMIKRFYSEGGANFTPK